MHLAVAARIFIDPRVLHVSVAPIELRGLERVGGDEDLRAAAGRRLLLRRREHPAAEAVPASIGAHPDVLDVRAASPRPPGEPSLEISLRVPAGDAQQRAVADARRLLVELDDA